MKHERILRLIAIRVAGVGLSCQQCPHGARPRPAETCSRLTECILEREELLSFGRGLESEQVVKDGTI